MASALIPLAMTACASTTPVYVQPHCTIPKEPTNLPKITKEDLKSVSDSTYWKLQHRESTIVDWAFEMQAKLKTICQHPEGTAQYKIDGPKNLVKQKS